MAITHPTDEQFSKILFESINAALLKQAEPIIEKAVKDFEAQIRERLAAILISKLQTGYSIERMGAFLNIKVGM